MPEKRDKTRYHKRLQLRFGAEEPVRLGFTEDISREGLFIKTANVFPPKTKLKIDLLIPDGNVVRVEGVVRWAKKVPPNFIHLVKKSGMGVLITRLVSGENAFSRLFAQNNL